ncbi:hypothetical protein C8Q75DRAFT_8847 [Abortiporus biennis]|nr:hypothetical protein C8Q75DRAFT_8847 [Abortiporus biennis]
MMLNKTARCVEEILKQMDYHRRALADLAFDLNSFTLVSRLPDELLCQIFEHYRDDIWEERSFDFSRITCVCRYWRNLAVNYGPLWSHVRVSDSNFGKDYPIAKTQLTASGGAPLTIEANFDYTDLTDDSEHMPFLYDIFNEFSRIQHLKLTLSTLTPPISHLLSAQQSKNNVLSSLDISVHSQTPSGPKLFRIPPSWSSPSLTKIKICGFTLQQIQALLLPTVEWFDFTYHYDSSESSPSITHKLHDLLASLKNMRVLVHLDISTKTTENVVDTSSQSITLPFLKVLSIHESTENVIHILTALVLPAPLKMLRLEIREGEFTNFSSPIST